MAAPAFVKDHVKIIWLISAILPWSKCPARPGERQLHSNNPNHLPYILEFGSLINPEAASWMGSNPSRFSHKKWLIYGSLGVWRLGSFPGRPRAPLALIHKLSTSYQ